MAGISSKALNKTENKFKYNGKEEQRNEFSDGSGLDWYDYGMREYDNQIGRFFRIDPISEHFYQLTAYQYASNDPIGNIDLDGLEGKQAVTNGATKEQKLSNPGPIRKFFQGYKDGFVSHFSKLSAQVKTYRDNPGTVMKEGLNQVFNPVQKFRNIWNISPLKQLADNTLLAKNFVGNLKNGNFFEAGKIAGEKGGEATMQLGVMVVTAGLAKGSMIARNTLVAEGSVTESLGTRFVTQVEVNSRGNVVANGTVDLQPTFNRIARGDVGSHITRNDGIIYRNDNGLLPQANGLTYNEYNIPTPGQNGAGAMRLVVGSDGSAYFTSNHYQSFVKVK